MARYYSAQIGSLYITKDGTNTGVPCKIEQEGVDLKKFTKTMKIDKDADGNAYALIVLLPSVPVVITVSVMTQAQFNALATIHQNALNAESTVSVVLIGDTGTFNLTCLMKAVRFNKFSNGYIDGVRIELETT